jgi:leader peptidase (prepilin peptidase)/N-methyltransferase
MSALELLATSPSIFLGTCLVLGLAVGSFLNVVIYRLPIMLDREWRQQCAEFCGDDVGAQTLPAATAERFDLVTPRSACPRCRVPITALQNIPVVSWLILGGRCANCGTRIGLRYPMIEILTGVLSAVVAWRFGFGWPALAALVLTWFLVALTFIDIDHQLLPDSLTLPLLWIGLSASLWGAPADALSLPVDLRSSLIGAIVGYVSLWSV